MKVSPISCCGEKMTVKIETPLYSELQCSKCGDIIIIKKDKNQKPVLLDD